ncbi:unnamed protein product [Adineta steineri]|uniref:Uncharacterized protein n=1 Tax=Adineta steineri TaxID=433720 RepID=A0A819R795_9BILA|nr:unnamed protein product [Adineta steineri]CAF4039989.1 unnamed protein product [Adineta steineri]
MADKNHLIETSTKLTTTSMVLTQASMTTEEMIGFENKSISDHIHNSLHVPIYLTSMINNKFERMVQQKIFPRASCFKIEKLGSIAILIYKIYALDLENCLWNHYLKAATGILIANEFNLKICPKDIQTKLELAPLLTTTTNHDSNQIQMNDKYYIRFIREHLRKFNEKQQQLKLKLSRKKARFHVHTNKIEDTLKMFIQENIRALRLEYEHEIQSVEFEYRERIFEHALQQQNNTTEQIELIKQLVNQKDHYEQIKQQVVWIKHNINHHRLPQILRSVEISLPSSIQSLINMDLNEYLFQHRITQRYKKEMITKLIDSIESTLGESQTLFNEKLEQMQQSQCQITTDQQLYKAIINLIEQHLLVITDKVQHLYKFRDTIMNLI